MKQFKSIEELVQKTSESTLQGLRKFYGYKCQSDLIKSLRKIFGQGAVVKITGKNFLCCDPALNGVGMSDQPQLDEIEQPIAQLIR